MSALGQKRTFQSRADVGFTSNSGHYGGASKIRSPGWRKTTLANLHLLFQGMMKSQQRWKARRGLPSFACCAMVVLLPLNSAKTITNSSAPLSQEICTLSSV